MRAVALNRVRPLALREAVAARLWEWAALGAIVALAAFLHFFRLAQEGYGNLYYAAAVKSMLSSWHNFFFASFDPGGFVTVDKPPLGLWVQAASAAAFGLNGFALMLPQALAGVISVVVLYHLARRAFGPAAGLLAALALAVTPISVAADRNNTMDGLLVLTSLLAAWAVILAAESGRLRWLLAGAILVGLGFNIKMLQAYLVLPALALLYLAAAPVSWRKRLVHLSLAAVVLLTVSFAWVAAVDLTPADARPYVGSSSDNTARELVIGHNGLDRLGDIAGWLGLPGRNGPPRRPGPPPAGQAGQPPPGGGVGQPAPAPGGGPFQPPPVAGGQQPPPGQAPPPGGQGARADGPGPTTETGEPGPLRLFNEQLAGQASWLLPLAALGLVVAAWQTRPSFHLGKQHQALLLWGAWLIPQVIFFSWAGLFHRYYLEMLSPAIAALVGAGLVAAWNDYRQGRRRGWLLPGALAGAAAAQVGILTYFPDWGRWLIPAVIGLAGASALTLVALRFWKSELRAQFAALALAAGIAGLLVAPAAWATTPLWNGGDTGLPFAGPELLDRGGRPGPQTDPKLLEYLSANRQGEEFLVATLNTRDAAPIILETGEPVMALGGFSGGDQILSADELAGEVSDGVVRFFLLPPDAPQQEAARWVQESCAAVPTQLWQPVRARPVGPSPPPPGGAQSPPQGQGLYDCGAVVSTGAG
ncbi:MAG: glycosyltransferase family 39 protein [Chloroflexi bacterium]|nr:glycosyltransferase family 39 protein [Chloroflexota bacterium]